MRETRLLPPRLVGRAPELEAALGSVQQVDAATGHALVIEGEPGIGKTRLADAVVEAAVDGGFAIARGSGHELERDLPFAPLLESLGVRADASDDRRAEVAAATVGHDPSVPIAWGDDSAQRRLRAVELIVQLIEDLSRERPLALVIEDLHWVDSGTFTVLGRLARRLDQVPVLTVVTTRPYPRPEGLVALVGALETVRSTRIVLEGLSPDAVEELARDVLGAPPGPNLRDELAGTGGNPLYVTQLLHALAEDGTIEETPSGVDVPEAKLPPSLRVAVLRRFAALPEDTTQLLKIAAVLGSSFHPGALAVVADAVEPDVVADLEPALRSDLLVDAGDTLAFRHDLVRDALYEDLPEAARSALHAKAARSLAAADYPTIQVAPHLLRGSLRGDAPTVSSLRHAAEGLRPLSPDVSVDLLERAVELLGPSDPTRDEIRAELAMAYMWANRPVEATRLSETLLQEVAAGPVRRSALFVRVMMSQYVGGGASIDELTRAASEPDVAEDERARLLAVAAYLLVVQGDVVRGEEVARQAVAAGEAVGDALGTCGGLSVCAMAEQALGLNRQAVETARRAVEAARQSRDDAVLLVAPELSYGMIAGNEPDLVDEAITMLQEGLARAERHGLVGFEVNFREALGINLYRAGRWDEAAVELETAVARRRELGAAPSELVHAASRLARIAVHRDDLATARRWVEFADSLPEESLTHDLAVHVAYARAELRAAEGDPESALQCLDDGVQALGPGLRPMAETVTAAPRIRLALELGRQEEARRWLAAVADHPTVAASDIVVPWMRALLDRDLESLLETVGHVRVHGCPLAEDLPQMLEDAAALATRSASDGAVRLLEEARDRWNEMGAVRDVSRVDAKLRELGVRRGARGRRGRPSTGWEALTETELRVLEVVAEGLTYREVGERLFISRRTVETHISHMFTKLDVSNRAELVTAYSARRDGAG